MLMDNIDKDEKTETKVTKTTKEIPNYQERSINKMFENSIFSLQGPTYLPIEKLDWNIILLGSKAWDFQKGSMGVKTG